jgi:3-ketosteroid 9alpha-monooxygenase subunit B
VGTTLLDLMLDNGLDAPYSCKQGQCSACTCRLQKGEVDLRHNEVLDDDDLAEGYTLACQSMPISESVSITYD